MEAGRQASSFQNVGKKLLDPHIERELLRTRFE